MAVIIDTLGIAKNTNIDATEMSVGVGTSVIKKIYELKASKIYKQGIGSNDSSKYKVEHDGEIFYIQQVGVVVSDTESCSIINTMDYLANRILVCRDNKSKKTLFSFPIGGFHAGKRDSNNNVTEYHLVCKTCSKTFYNTTNDIYSQGEFDIVVYEIENIQKWQTVVSVEKSVSTESYGQYNTVYNSSISNTINMQDCKIIGDWDTLNSLVAGFDSNYIMFPCWIWNMSNYFPCSSKNTSVSTYSLEADLDIDTQELSSDFDYSTYENFFKLLIPKDKKVIKRAGLYTINLSGEYF